MASKRMAAIVVAENDLQDEVETSNTLIENDDQLITPEKRAKPTLASTGQSKAYVESVNDEKKEKRKKIIVFSDEIKYQYKTIEEIYSMFPIVNGPKLVHLYGIILSFKNETNELLLMDETRDSFKLSINVVYDSRTEESFQPNQFIDHRRIRRLQLRTGDIIRIHRLSLYNDFSRRCPAVKNVVIFESFRKNLFSPLFLSKNPTFTIRDSETVEKLIKFNVNRLLNAKITKAGTKNWSMIDTAFQVLCVKTISSRVYLAVWNGNRLLSDEFPSYNYISRSDILHALSKCTARHMYTEPHLTQLYNDKRLTYIHVYGIHRTAASALRPLDVIVPYNLLIRQDQFYNGYFSFVIHDGLTFGRTIRLADEKSLIAKKLYEQIEQFYFLNDECLENDGIPSQIMSPSDIYNITTDDDSDDDDEEKPKFKVSKPWLENRKSQKKLFVDNKFESLTLNETALGSVEIGEISCKHLSWSIFEKDIIYKHFFMKYSRKAVANSNSDAKVVTVHSFAEINDHLLKSGNTMVKFELIARFVDCFYPKFSTDNRQHESGAKDYFRYDTASSFRQYGTEVRCTSSSSVRVCGYRTSFEEFLRKSPCYREVNGSVRDISTNIGGERCTFSNNRLRCPGCTVDACVITLRLILGLRDYDNHLAVVRLEGPQSNILLSTSTSELCSNSAKLPRRLGAIFKYMHHISNDSTECNKTIIWTIGARLLDDKLRSDNSTTISTNKIEFEYEVIDWSLPISIGVGNRR